MKIDGVEIENGSSLFIKNVDSLWKRIIGYFYPKIRTKNGFYIVSECGDKSKPYILTREEIQ